MAECWANVDFVKAAEKKCCPLKKALLIGGAVIGAAAIANAVIASSIPPVKNNLGGVFNRYPFRYGDIAYTVAGSGSPVLLLHGIGAGNSMAEWKENFSALAEHHTVYALDFLGWGLSDKPDIIYSPLDMTEQIEFFIHDVIGEPLTVIASSDACAYAIEAAKRNPELIQKLILVAPPSVGEPVGEDAPASKLRKLVQGFFQLPVIGQSAFNLVASRRYIEEFTKRHLYFDKSRVTERVLQNYYVSAHQPNAVYGFISFITGAMRHDARHTWGELSQPALLIWGRNSLLTPLETAPEWLAMKPDARLEVIDRAMLLPHTEHPEEWNKTVLEWIAAS